MLYPEIHFSSMLAMIADEADDLRGWSGRGLGGRGLSGRGLSGRGLSGREVSAGNIGAPAKDLLIVEGAYRRVGELQTVEFFEHLSDQRVHIGHGGIEAPPRE
jgi:hypothetical protein